MSEFDVYEKHFTVMNYGENLVLKHLKCEDFLNEWKEQFADHQWTDVEDKICEMLKGTFVGATQKKPPCGIANNPQSRGLYAADIMLSWDDGKIQPKLLEVNFIPDCKRACEYYNDFYNDIFKLLFLGQDNPEVFRRFT
jgi:tubulin--tyrosine ligase-like protein 12